MPPLPHLQPLLHSDLESSTELPLTAPEKVSSISSSKRDAPKPRTSSQCKLTIAFVLLSLLVFLGWTYNEEQSQYSYSSHSRPSDGSTAAGETTPALKPERLAQCPASVQAPPSLPVGHNPWLPLSASETLEIQEWLETGSGDKFVELQGGLNLTAAHLAKVNDNAIYNIELATPPKDAVLAYMDGKGEVERYARVTIHHGGLHEPHVKDWRVGPLPISDKTAITSMMHIYHRPTIPYNARGLGDLAEAFNFMERLVAPLKDAMEDLFGTLPNKPDGTPGDTFVAGPTGPWSFDGSFRRIWITWRYNVAGSFILPINFYNYVDMSGTDEREWKILRIVYHNQTFPSAASFLEAYHNGTLVRFPRPNLVDESAWDWASRIRPYTIANATSVESGETAREGLKRSQQVEEHEQSKKGKGKKGHGKKIPAPARDLDHLPGPRQVSFAGKRFRVHKQQRHITWMGWSFYTGFDRDMGVNLWDIRFRGERIAYQIAPQEAIAQYAGADPVQSTTAWLDRYFGMGTLVRNLIPHYDCPSEAVFLGGETWHANLGSRSGHLRRTRALCIFEHDTAKPLTRHTGDELNEMGATKGYVLVVRSISTVGNYDYLFDYTFQLDGTIEVRLSASGYLQGAYWNDAQKDYGNRIRGFSMGSLHDHVINFKVDLDIAGTKNSLLQTTMKQQEIKLPFFMSEDEEGFDDWGSTVTQQVTTRTLLPTESEAQLYHASNFEGSYAIVNTEELNKWGNWRGYAVHPGVNSIHNTVVGSKRLLHNANWAKYNLAVTQRKEDEPSSSCQWNLQLSGAPGVNFDKFFNNESISQQDLVLWINVGMHHLPQAEDSPNTKTNIATSSFVLTPLNYFNEDISGESINSILLNHPGLSSKLGETGEVNDASKAELWDIQDYGVKQDFNCIPPSVDKVKYEGERVVFATSKGSSKSKVNGQGNSAGDADSDAEEIVDALLTAPDAVKQRVKGVLYPLKIRTGI